MSTSESQPEVLWAVVSKSTGKVRTFTETRTAARTARKNGERVLKYVADFQARA